MTDRRSAIRSTAAFAAAFLAFLAGTPAEAGTPPALVNYQGVLRDGSNNLLNGTYSMTFAFWSAATGGDEIMLDAHNGTIFHPLVQVSSGLFSTALGSGALSDGAGPGTVTALADVFRFYGDVWLEIRIGGEVLTPRVHMLSAAYAENAATLAGHQASEFLDTSSTAQSRTGRLTIDDASSTAGYGVVIQSAGVSAVLGASKTASGVGYLGYADIGVWGIGNYSGGYFQSKNASGSVLLGYGDVGVQGDGRVSGGVFTQSDGHGIAYLGQNGVGGSFYNSGTGYVGLASGDYGLVASGTYPGGAGGSFSDPYYTGSALCAIGNTGIVASGSYQGGEFYDTDGSGHARLGFGGTGVYGIGNVNEDFLKGGGGYFEDASGSGTARAGQGDIGLTAGGNSTGGHFSNASGSDVYLPSGDTGLVAIGPTTGGYYSNYYGVYANLAYWNGSSAYTIQGNGAKSFVQNHPYDPQKSVVFVALEGDEAGTYTRGQGRTSGGVAHVPLSSSFALVTNPDVGLTATVTPRGTAVSLALDRLSTDEMVVRAPAGSDDVTFDYTVFGLRLGFEPLPIVQPRVDEAPLPAMAAATSKATTLDAAPPAPGSALERFAAMRAATGETAPLDLTRSAALKAAIGVAKEGAPPDFKNLSPAPHGHPPTRMATPRPSDGAAGAVVSPGAGTGAPASPGAAATAGASSAAAGGSPTGSDRFPAATAPIAVEGTVHGGDVVGLRSGGTIAAAVFEKGGMALGIVAGDPETAWSGLAPIALGGSIVRCRVDASAGAIAVGDLLTPSALGGFAQRAAAVDGAPIVAKALEPLTEGRGIIRVLAVAR
jgi:hypothetical protein